MTATPATLDPDLQALPSPRRPWRRLTLIVMASTAIASLLLFIDLLPLAKYALHNDRPTDIGALTDVQLEPEHENRWVRAEGELAHRGTSYRRPLESDRYRLVPVRGRSDIWIELRVPEGISPEHYLPPVSFVGRLVPLDEVGIKYDDLGAAMKKAGPVASADDIWVLIDGQSPATVRWALAVLAMSVAFFLFNLWGLLHLLRPVRA